ncbi:MAG: ATP-dependent zinc metalloprotease FtsH [Myxococcales bacterium]|nr:ATP-dependent zinc metalloprotease FtsH [Myxococcales bacterium]
MMIMLAQMFASGTPSRAVSFSEFMNDVRQHHVIEVRVKDREVSYRRQLPSGAVETRETVSPTNWELQREILNHSDLQHPIQITNEKDENNGYLAMFVQFLPMVLLVLMFMFVMRQLQSGGGKAMSFGKSRARLASDGQNKITFADVAGVEEAKDEVEEIIAFLKDPKKFRRLGGRIPKGVLLSGPPGTGKTLLARAIAGEAGVPFFSISGSDFVEMFVGVGASRVRDLFEQGKKHAPCIIFIDEIDAVGRQRGGGIGGGHDEREQTLNQLLVEMDGFDGNDGVIIVAATNRPDVLDPAILRPGRFDRRITVPRPDVKGREEILRVHTRKVPLSTDVELGILARGTPGFAGADLENLVNEAALLAARQDKDVVSMVDFELAKDKVIMGVARKNIVMTEETKKITAYHEAGHTLAALLIEGNDAVHKVTIIPRGPALGVTVTLPTEDVYNRSREQLEARIAMTLGGRTAEELIFGRANTGAASDIQRATQYARYMVCQEGMSEKLGLVAYGQNEEQPFLGRDLGNNQRDYSEQTAIEIDNEVRRIIHTQREKVRAVLTEHRPALDRLALALLERETLDAEEIAACVDDRPLPERARPVIPSWSDRREKRDAGRSSKVSILPPRGVPSGT